MQNQLMPHNFEYYIICVDDDKAFLDSMKIYLNGKFDDDPINCYNLIYLDDPLKALELINDLTGRKEEVVLIITDQMMPNMKGIDLLKKIREISKDTMNVLLTGYAGIESAVEAINRNVLDKYLSKPIEDKEDLVFTLKHLINEYHLKKTAEYHKQLVTDLYEFSNRLNSMTGLVETLNYVLEFTKNTLQCERISIFLYDGGKLILKAGIGIGKDLIDKIRISAGQGIAGMVFKERKACHVKQLSELPWDIDRINPDFDSFISAPLIYADLRAFDKPLGVINATNKIDNKPFEQKDLKAMAFIADTASIAINNQINRHLLEDSYFNTVTSLGMALEAKDSYTNGHSIRVMEYCMEIARIMGLDADRVEKLKKASLLHDIGKIGIKDEILLKPGRLTDAEFEEIKKHPILSQSIIDPIGFLKDVIPIVRHHHEKIDGTGYPDGLKGGEIPLEAKIMAVADAYDAMTSQRAYRKPLDMQKVIDELNRCSNTQFDKECVAALMKIIEKEQDK